MMHRLHYLFFLIILLTACNVDPQPTERGSDHSEDDRYWARLAQDYPAFELDPASLVVASPSERHILGVWSSVIPWRHVPVSAANLPDGRLLTWASNQRNSFPSNIAFTYTATWDPQTGAFIEIPHPGHDMFCAAQVMLEDGRVFVNGGNFLFDAHFAETSIFDYRSNTWQRVEAMANGRWYPTSVAMPDGSVFTAAGESGGNYPELWRSGSGWRTLNGINLRAPILDYWRSHFEQNWWPLLNLAPNGLIFHSGPTPRMHWIDPRGSGSIQQTGPEITGWYPKDGVTVMYDEGKLLVAGGAKGPRDRSSANRAMLIDINSDSPVLSPIASMRYERKYHNGVVLPNGEVIIIGGNTTGLQFDDRGSMLTPEIWNPETRSWRSVADISVPRNYHSVALLLTDGRVWSAGGGLCACAADHPNAQVFTPPYLYNPDGSFATRPVISSAPAVIRRGEQFALTASEGISDFSFIKMSSTTHAVNTDQRFIRLPFSDLGGGQYRLSAHGNLNVMTPGYWMLFALNAKGVPSVARVIQVSSTGGSDPAPLPQPQPLELEPLSSSPQAISTPVNYTAAFSGGSSPRFSWNFGDGSPSSPYSSSPSISHTFSAPGRYLVSVTATDSTGVRRSQQVWQVIHGTLGEQQARASSSILYESRVAGDRIWVVNPDNDSVAVIDASSHQKLAEIPVGRSPRSLARAADGRIWVTSKLDAGISIIGSQLSVEQTVKLPAASQPHGLVFDPEARHAYVALEATGQILQLEPLTAAVRASLDVGPTPRHLSIAADGRTLYVSRFITPPVPGEDTATPRLAEASAEVLLIDTANFSLRGSIKLQHSDRPDAEHGGRGIPNYLGALAISPAGHSAWLPSKQDNIARGSLRDGRNLNHENTVRAISSVIDLGSEQEIYAARIDHDNAGIASAAVFDPLGLLLFVALENTREIAVIDTLTRQAIARFEVGRAPQGLVISPDGATLYVQNYMDRSVTVTDISALYAETETSLLAVISTVASDALSPQVLRGKQLFHDSRDPRLAAEGYISCSACHSDGGHDGRVWDFTGLGEGLRNTISLLGRGGAADGRLHWSGNFDEVQDFEGQIRALAGGTGLMSDADFLTGSRAEPLGDAKTGISSDLDALAAYVTSLDSYHESPYRDAGGSLTVQAMQGRSVFQQANCSQCHGGAGFRDSETLILHDIGTLSEVSGSRLGDRLTGINTPTLRDLWHTAPYLHNGAALSLKDAVKAHQNVSLSEQELELLVSYLQQIDAREPAMTLSDTLIIRPSVAQESQKKIAVNEPAATALEFSAQSSKDVSLHGVTLLRKASEPLAQPVAVTLYLLEEGRQELATGLLQPGQELLNLRLDTALDLTADTQISLLIVTDFSQSTAWFFGSGTALIAILGLWRSRRPLALVFLLVLVSCSPPSGSKPSPTPSQSWQYQLILVDVDVRLEGQLLLTDGLPLEGTRLLLE